MAQFSSHIILNSINKFLKSQTGNPCIKKTVSILTFNTSINKLIINKELISLRKLTYDDIRVNGYTALYDAFHNGITLLNNDNTTNKTLVVITDGMENSSDISIGEIITEIRKSQKKGLLIKFLGGGQDAIKVGMELGIDEGNCLTFSNDDYGLEGAFLAASSSLERHTCGENHQFTGLERISSQTQSY